MSSTTVQTWVNHNKHITDKLEVRHGVHALDGCMQHTGCKWLVACNPMPPQELLVVYKNDGEKWRVMSTTKAIQAIKKYPKEITTLEVRNEYIVYI